MWDKIVQYIMEKMVKYRSKGLDVVMYDNREEVSKWTRIYEGSTKVVWGDEYGHTMNLGAAIASELARLVTIEMRSNITGGLRAQYLDTQYQKVIEKLRVNMEYVLAKGGVIMKPYIYNDTIGVEFIQADKFIPLKFDINGDLTSVAFIDRIDVKGKTFTKLEVHSLDDDNYTIYNKAFVSMGSDDLGAEVSLSTVAEWSDLEPEVSIGKLSKPLFVYLKNPVANNKSSGSRLGVSVFSKSEHLIEDADELYNNLRWEFQSKQSAVDVSEDMFTGTGEMPKLSKRLFRMLDDKSATLYNVYSPEIREQSIINGLELILRRIEYNVGLAYGTLSQADRVEKTAEEIRSSKERSYSTVVDLQKSLEESLVNLVEVFNILADLYELAPSDGSYDINFEFDDSIVVDKSKKVENMLEEVKLGIMKPEYYLMERYGITLEEALERLPSN